MHRWQVLLYRAQMSCLHVSIYLMLIRFSIVLATKWRRFLDYLICLPAYADCFSRRTLVFVGQGGNDGYGVTESGSASIDFSFEIVQWSRYCFATVPGCTSRKFHLFLDYLILFGNVFVSWIRRQFRFSKLVFKNGKWNILFSCWIQDLSSAFCIDRDLTIDEFVDWCFGSNTLSGEWFSSLTLRVAIEILD